MGGGVERGTIEVNQALTAAHAESYVISGGGPLVGVLEKDGGTHITLDIGRKSLFTLRRIPALRKIIAELNPDVVHARSRLPAWLAWRALRGLEQRPAFVTTVHGLYSVSWYSAIMVRGDRVIAVSDTARKYIVDNYEGVDRDVLHVIPRGIDRLCWPFGYQPSRAWLADWRRELDAYTSPEAPLILLPGRVKRSKGVETLIRLLCEFRQAGTPVRGVIVGRGATSGRSGALLTQLIREHDLASWLLRFEHREDVRDLMSVAGCVLSLSEKPESFGRTVLEALSLGIPVVGVDHGGVGEVMRAIYPQGLVAKGDVAALKQKVQLMLEAPPPIPPDHEFSLSKMLTDTLALYRDVAGISVG